MRPSNIDLSVELQFCLYGSQSDVRVTMAGAWKKVGTSPPA